MTKLTSKLNAVSRQQAPVLEVEYRISGNLYKVEVTLGLNSTWHENFVQLEALQCMNNEEQANFLLKQAKKRGGFIQIFKDGALNNMDKGEFAVQMWAEGVPVHFKSYVDGVNMNGANGAPAVINFDSKGKAINGENNDGWTTRSLTEDEIFAYNAEVFDPSRVRSIRIVQPRGPRTK